MWIVTSVPFINHAIEQEPGGKLVMSLLLPVSILLTAFSNAINTD